MPAIGINMSDRDPVKGWADTKPTHHQNPISDWADRAWKVSSRMFESGCTRDEIMEMESTARKLENYAHDGIDCTCTPDFDCPVCREVAKVIYWERIQC